MTTPRVLCFLLVLLLGPALRPEPASGSSTSAEGSFLSAEALVSDLYRSVSFEAGAGPDWDHVRSMFLEEAVIVLRTAKDATTVFSVEGFVADFVAFIERANARETGFTERIVRMSTTTYGDLAHAMVLYEASIPGSEPPPQQGLDCFQLILKDARWWIVSVTNELVTSERPLPAALRE